MEAPSPRTTVWILHDFCDLGVWVYPVNWETLWHNIVSVKAITENSILNPREASLFTWKWVIKSSLEHLIWQFF